MTSTPRPTRPLPRRPVRLMLSMTYEMFEALQEQARRELRSPKSEAIRLIRDGLAAGTVVRRR